MFVNTHFNNNNIDKLDVRKNSEMFRKEVRQF